MEELSILLAFLSGFLEVLGLKGLSEHVNQLRALMTAFGIFGLIAPALGIINYTAQVVQTDPTSGIVTAAYALGYYTIYYTMWILGAALGGILEKAVRDLGYETGKAIALM